MRSRDICFCLMTVGLTTFSGCGGGRPTLVPVAGKVFIDNKPLTSGTVVFVPEGGRQSTGSINNDGTFSLSCFKLNDGALIGKHKISVTSNESLNGDTALRWFIPPKYNEVSTSGLTQEIKGPTDSVMINLTWKGNKPSAPFIEQMSSEALDAESGMKAKMKRNKAGSKNDKKD